MSYVNKVILVGNVVEAPDLRYTPNGTAMGTIRIAVDRDYKPEGQDKPETDFFRVQLWRKQAENAANHLDKGAKVYVEGHIQNRAYEKDGQRRFSTDIIADKVKYLTWPKKDSQSQPEAAQTKQTDVENDWASLGKEIPDDEESPF